MFRNPETTYILNSTPQTDATEYNFPEVLIWFRFQKYPNACINHTSMW